MYRMVCTLGTVIFHRTRVLGLSGIKLNQCGLELRLRSLVVLGNRNIRKFLGNKDGGTVVAGGSFPRLPPEYPSEKSFLREE